MKPSTCTCGFRKGDRVKMVSSFTRLDGRFVGMVHGEVENEGSCHIVNWEETRCGTVLPNPNVVPDIEEEKAS
jgi:hypothetical protein